MERWSVWSGPSRWLFSCTVYIPCPTNACLTVSYAHDWPSNPHTCPRPQLVIVLIKGTGPSTDLLLINEPTWCQLVIPASLLLPCLAHSPPHTVDSRTLLQICKFWSIKLLMSQKKKKKNHPVLPTHMKIKGWRLHEITMLLPLRWFISLLKIL